MGNRFPFDGSSATRSVREARIQRPTITDVARAAGVSKGTVSKSMSGRPYVSVATRKRIERAAWELKYEPSVLARSLSTRRSFAIGVVVASVSNPFYPDLIEGVEDVIGKLGYTLLLATTEHDKERETKIFHSMLQRQVDGLVVAAVQSEDADIQGLVASGVHVVLASRNLATLPSDTVIVDNVGGAVMAVRHLQEHGHHLIAHVAGPQSILPFHERLSGYRQAVEVAGLEEPLITEADETTPSAGAAAFARLLDLPRRPTAVFVFNDRAALGVLWVCRNRGLRVPEDMALVGFDNIWVDAITASPLTSVDGKARVIGREAARLLMTRIDESHAPEGEDRSATEPIQILLSPRLILRESCGCPGSAGGNTTGETGRNVGSWHERADPWAWVQ